MAVCAWGMAAAVYPASARPADDRAIVAALSPSLRQAWVARKAGWARRTKQCAGQSACVAAVEEARQATIIALKARLATGPKRLPDLNAAVLRGTWIASPMMRFDGKPATTSLGGGLPQPDARVTGKPGQYCTNSGCNDLAFEPITLGTDRDARFAYSLGLDARSKGWVATVNGKADWTIFPVGRNLVILFAACAASYQDCGAAHMTLTPRSQDARLVTIE